MGWVTGIAVYVCIWWVVIFAVLPWGVRQAETPRSGFDPGAPENPRLPRKLLITTMVSAVVWGGLWLLVHSQLISFRGP